MKLNRRHFWFAESQPKCNLTLRQRYNVEWMPSERLFKSFILGIFFVNGRLLLLSFWVILFWMYDTKITGSDSISPLPEFFQMFGTLEILLLKTANAKCQWYCKAHHISYHITFPWYSKSTHRYLPVLANMHPCKLKMCTKYILSHSFHSW